MKEKYLITKTGDNNYEVEKERSIDDVIESLTLDAAPDSLIKTAIEAWKKVKADRSTSIKEATKIAGIIDLLEAAKGKEQKEQMEVLKKARSIGQEIKAARSKDEDPDKTKDEKGGWDKKDIPELKKQINIAENKIKEIEAKKEQSDLDKKALKGFKETLKINNERLSIANKTKDAKPFLIKFKDMHLEMVGYTSKKEAKEMAVIYRAIAHDATNEEILADAKRKVNWASLGMKEGMKAKQKLSDNWKHWIKEVEKGKWDVNKTVKELKKTFKTKDAFTGSFMSAGNHKESLKREEENLILLKKALIGYKKEFDGFAKEMDQADKITKDPKKWSKKEMDAARRKWDVAFKRKENKQFDVDTTEQEITDTEKDIKDLKRLISQNK